MLWFVAGYVVSDVLKDHSASIFVAYLILTINTLQSLEISGTTCPVTQHHIPEDSNLQQHCCENPKSHMVQTYDTRKVVST
jgi:hypothetical protein